MRTPSGRSSSARARSGWPRTLGGATTTIRPTDGDARSAASTRADQGHPADVDEGLVRRAGLQPRNVVHGPPGQNDARRSLRHSRRRCERA